MYYDIIKMISFIISFIISARRTYLIDMVRTLIFRPISRYNFMSDQA
jgi:hypothetical protein